ncbi:MAG: molecular chaperone DnaK [Myxococcales bacterium]|nr:MAG: molecular chaperone DnaK [Myxococcales bacterium]
MGKIIGIDLGTTNSCVAVIEHNNKTVIPNAEGARTTPSVVAFIAENERRIGQAAKRHAGTNPESTVFAIKRLMGTSFNTKSAQAQANNVSYSIVKSANGDAWVEIEGKQYSPPEISAMILVHMKEIAEAYLGEEVTEAVVTVPAYFNDAQRQATKDAGKIAGLEVKRIINEPTAAALAYGLDKKEVRKVAVYDLGGGTFDISILEIADGVFKVLSTNGDSYLGGEDFDQALMVKLAEDFESSTGIDIRKDRAALSRLKEQAQKARHELSSSHETEINLPFIAADATGPKHLVQTFKRSELEILCSELVDRTLIPCKNVLEDANLSVSDIDEVILVGGMTRMPMVQKRVAEFFEKEPSKGVNPDEVVAMGAAIQGAALSGDMEEVLLLDVTPLSLGVETGGGVFFAIIPRNTTIPTHLTEVFTTSLDNQSFVPIHVLQGERQMAADNKSLAQFELSPIPPAPRGVPQIEVAFDIDANGIVHVTAKDLGSGREQQVKVVASSGLDEKEIDQIIRESDEHRETDAMRRKLAELKNGAEALLYTSERAVKEYAEFVDASILDKVQEDIAALKETLVEPEAEAIRAAIQELEMSAFSIAEAMYNAPEEVPAEEAQEPSETEENPSETS